MAKIITSTDIANAYKIFRMLTTWVKSRAILEELFNNNEGVEHIFIKIMAVDYLYWTQLQKHENIITFTEKIKTKWGELDVLLQSGDTSAINEIVNIGEHKNWSFASKFCHFHNCSSYPIYDKYAAIAVRYLNDKWSDCSNENNNKYDNFIKGINSIKDSDISYQEADIYLWLLGQEIEYNKYIKKINEDKNKDRKIQLSLNKEIRKYFETNKANSLLKE